MTGRRRFAVLVGAFLLLFTATAVPAQAATSVKLVTFYSGARYTGNVLPYYGPQCGRVNVHVTWWLHSLQSIARVQHSACGKATVLCLKSDHVTYASVWNPTLPADHRPASCPWIAEITLHT